MEVSDESKCMEVNIEKIYLQLMGMSVLYFCYSCISCGADVFYSHTCFINEK